MACAHFFPVSTRIVESMHADYEQPHAVQALGYSDREFSSAPFKTPTTPSSLTPPLGSSKEAPRCGGRGGRGGQARLVKSKLATGESPIYRLAAEFQNYMHLPDPSPLYLVFGVAAAAMLKGPPVWMALVGASGSGKTMLIESLLSIAGVTLGGEISPASLLSGTKKKERTADSTGGLLGEAGSQGLLAWTEFTTVLAMDERVIRTSLGALRCVFDGLYTRPVGTDGGRSLTWRGRLGALVGCTHNIDDIHEVAQGMGDRLIYYRMDGSGDGRAEAFAALKSRDEESNRQERQETSRRFFADLGLSMHDLTATRSLTLGEMDWVTNIAMLGARGRSSVRRNYKHEITDIPQWEWPARIAKSLGQLYIALDFIGLDEADIRRILAKIALDSMPRLRGMLVRDLADESNGTKFAASISRRVRCAETTVERALDDLKNLDIADRHPGGWVLTKWAKQYMPVPASNSDSMLESTDA